MTRACERWMALSDRAAVGEALRESERAFFAEHAASCPECAREQAVYDELASLVEPAFEPVKPRRRVPWRSLLSVAAAALLLWFTREAPAQARLSEGMLEVDGATLKVGDRLAVGRLARVRGRACLQLEHGVSACFAAESKLRVAKLERDRRLELLQGKVIATLEPQPPGTSFGIVTREGSAVAVGTVFSVEVPARGDVVTRVLHGVVAVENRAGERRQLAAHRKTAMSGPTSELPASEEQRELLLSAATSEPQPAPVLEPAPVLRAEPMPGKEEPPSPAPADEPLPRPVRRARPAAPLTPKDAQASVRSEEAHADAQEPKLANPAPLQKTPSTAEAPPARVEAPARTTEVPGATSAAEKAGAEARAVTEDDARRLLLTARERTARGDAEGAIALYRQLFASADGSVEARGAWLPYGELLLARERAREALRAFERYLAARGPLAEEASFGRIRALRALKDRRAEQSAREEFLRAYPDSVLARSLQGAP